MKVSDDHDDNYKKKSELNYRYILPYLCTRTRTKIRTRTRPDQYQVTDPDKKLTDLIRMKTKDLLFTSNDLLENPKTERFKFTVGNIRT